MYSYKFWELKVKYLLQLLTVRGKNRNIKYEFVWIEEATLQISGRSDHLRVLLRRPSIETLDFSRHEIFYRNEISTKSNGEKEIYFAEISAKNNLFCRYILEMLKFKTFKMSGLGLIYALCPVKVHQVMMKFCFVSFRPNISVKFRQNETKHVLRNKKFRLNFVSSRNEKNSVPGKSCKVLWCQSLYRIRIPLDP